MLRDPHKDQPILLSGAPLGEARAGIVMLHGRGAAARDMQELWRTLERPEVACLAPAAFGGTWYPYSIREPIERNQSYLNSALRLVRRALEKAQAGGVPPERVVLFGFSQGGCVALELAVRQPQRFGGLAALSAGLLGAEGTPRDYEGSLLGTPVFLACGDADAHVPRRRVEQTAAVLERLGARVTTRIYAGMAHAINDDEMAFVRSMLDDVLAGAT
ncbi:MAG TPA: dienelactone hydrolase family protein [Gemmatimonadales bacterium]|nr:dienelactone hydrolase family protein [Gemmatimonadales bacterium]